ncbi:hypothetical protein EW026_g7626 [Hermanssonia centrifuga]|uniref:rRNA 2'-O-methyltransferase fibrillarin n=1 Tax=Hermanssonia centrifuga TaxID=98765 RepID=A0A4S4K777_9APHY|nr:hypothetical protein EW026_g7626 [Hermanssonia centrifuga]
MLASSVDVIFADVAQLGPACIVVLNAKYFLKNGGHVVISIISIISITGTASPETVFAQEVHYLRK